MRLFEKWKRYSITRHERAISRLSGNHWYQQENTSVGPCSRRDRPLYFKDVKSLEGFLDSVPTRPEVSIGSFTGTYDGSADIMRRVIEIPHGERDSLFITTRNRTTGAEVRITFKTGISGNLPSTIVEGDVEGASEVMRLADRLCDPIPRWFGRNAVAVVEPATNEEEAADRKARTLNQKGYAISAVISVCISGVLPVVLKKFGI